VKKDFKGRNIMCDFIEENIKKIDILKETAKKNNWKVIEVYPKLKPIEEYSGLPQLNLKHLKEN